jgi:hypothetical protein
MQGLAIFSVFFTIFLVSSLVIPSPLFPGNFICYLAKIDEANFLFLVSAFTNGIFYGSISWLISILSFRLVRKSLSKNKLGSEK